MGASSWNYIFFRHCKGTDNLSPAVIGNCSITPKDCMSILMYKILAPRFECFRCFADFLTKLREIISKAMRIKIGKASFFKILSKYFSDWRGC